MANQHGMNAYRTVDFRTVNTGISGCRIVRFLSWSLRSAATSTTMQPVNDEHYLLQSLSLSIYIEANIFFLFSITIILI